MAVIPAAMAVFLANPSIFSISGSNQKGLLFPAGHERRSCSAACGRHRFGPTAVTHTPGAEDGGDGFCHRGLQKAHLSAIPHASVPTLDPGPLSCWFDLNVNYHTCMEIATLTSGPDLGTQLSLNRGATFCITAPGWRLSAAGRR